MKRNYTFLALLLLLLLALPGRAQELQAEVTITTDNVTVSDRQLIQQMKNDMQSFLNTRTWTNLTYKPEERIRCRLFVSIQKIPQNGTYECITRIVTTRPVYGTGYETNLMSFADKGWVFNYTPQQPLDYSENAFVSNLSSLLSFYAYVIIGMDQDSFSRLGGNAYFDRARNILSTAGSQSQENDQGWKDTGDTRSRYALLTNLQDPQLEGVRTGAYGYYRQGMDVFITKPEEARASVFTALQGVQQVAIRRPATVLVRSFFDAKADEIANIFRTSPDAEQKQKVVSMLSEVDPTNSAKYQAILK
ncbi:DUF4835 family protein [Hymenobacter sp. BT175]|uniref:type IX secretion system protein PorD n=1 Tax=Hymenobacter translucens TaxID=2886507 RepID=UPI001D0DDC02|nr:DUF4835 family protein [Hymenobacter translucens]MCC2547853.1 DUF4835 family protein [Hymenobacter translucens]